MIMIEDLFASTTRYRDLYNHKNPAPLQGALPLDFTEVELTASCEDLLKTAYSWEDFCVVARNNIVWMGETVFVQFGSFSVDAIDVPVQRPLTIRLENAFGSYPMEVRALAGSDGVSRVCDCLLQLLSTSTQTTDVRLTGQGTMPISSSSLLKFLQQTSNLQRLRLSTFTLLEDQCGVLAATPNITNNGSPLEIELCYCKLYDVRATDALVEAIRQNRGPTKLERCEMDTLGLADALRGNDSVKALTLRGSYGNAANDLVAIRALAHALEDNHGLVRLDMSNRVISTENWKALCQSLQTHPTLEVLILRTTTSSIDRRDPGFKDRRTSRMRHLEEMLKVNTVMHTIDLESTECDKALLQQSIRPRLERNLYRPRVCAMKQADSLRRAKLLGQALKSKQWSPDALWMFLSQNEDIIACCSNY
jgi:hypothetical protein